jgi:hypothetical protein
MTVLDRILASVRWDAKHSLAKVSIMSKGVRDHNPLVIRFGEKLQIRDPLFRFEKWWLRWRDSLILLRIFGSLSAQ